MSSQIDEIREYLYARGGESRSALSEREIAEQFSITRNHARELLLELVGEGVVERHPRSGYNYVSYNDTSVKTAMLLRFVVEEEAAAKAMQNADREDDVRLVLACDALKKAAEQKDLPAYAAADRVFHLTLVRASHDNMLIRVFGFLLATLFRQEALKPCFSEMHTKTQVAHEELVKAFLSRDAKVMLERLKRHLAYPLLKERLAELASPLPRKNNEPCGTEGEALFEC